MNTIKFIIICSMLMIGCGPGSNEAVLSIKPYDAYVPLPGANPLTYYYPFANDNPYWNNNWVIQVGGLIGNYKLILENKSDTELTNVGLIVSANDPSKINRVLIFARIYRDVFSGGGVFAFDGPPQLPDGTYIYAQQKYPGKYAYIGADDLPPHSYVIFDSILLGDPGLELHFEAFATMDDHYALSYGNDETTIAYIHE